MSQSFCNRLGAGLFVLAGVLLTGAVFLAPTGAVYGDGGGGTGTCLPQSCRDTCIQSAWPSCPAQGAGCSQTVQTCAGCICKTVNFGDPPFSGSCECGPGG